MTTIAILNEKGGSGKTTLSTNLAWDLRERGLEVLLVDADPQGTATDWFDASDGAAPTTIQLAKATQLRELDRFASGAEVVVIDGPPGLSVDLTPVLIKAADVVLIPVQPSAGDIWAADNVAEIVRRRQEALGEPEAAFVVSRQVTGTRLAGGVEEALEALGLPVLKGRTSQRVAYAEAVGYGSWAGEHDPKAAEEVTTITDEVLELCRKATR